MSARSRSIVDDGDAGVGFELLRGSGCERAADDLVPGRGPGVACGGEREGLPGTGDAFDDLDTVTRRADGLHHLRLLAGEGSRRASMAVWIAVSSATPVPVPRRPSAAVRRRCLGLEHLRCGPPVLVGPRRHHGAVAAVHDGRTVVDPDREDVFGAEEPVDEVEDLIDPATRRQRVADRFDNITLTERAHRRRQPVRGRQPPVQILGLRASDPWRPRRGRAIQEPGQRRAVEAKRLGAAAPGRKEPGRVCTAVLGAAGGVGRNLRRPCAVLPVLVEVGLDLPATGRELPQHGLGDPGDVGDAVLDRTPTHAEPAGEIPPKMCLVEVTDRRGPRVQRPGVERRPPVVRLRVGNVRDDHVGMEVGVAGPGGAVPERGTDKPVAVEHRAATRAASDPARDLLEDLHRLPHRSVGSVADLVRDLRCTQGVEERHRLRARRTWRRTRRPSAPIATMSAATSRSDPRAATGSRACRRQPPREGRVPQSRRRARCRVLPSRWCSTPRRHEQPSRRSRRADREPTSRGSARHPVSHPALAREATPHDTCKCVGVLGAVCRRALGEHGGQASNRGV